MSEINLLIEGIHCPSCVSIIESNLKAFPEVVSARINLSTKRLTLKWLGDSLKAEDFVKKINAMGYSASIFDIKISEIKEQTELRFLLKCLAVAGFATGNLMLFSVPLWSSNPFEMGEATRAFFHWAQAIIAIPALAYAGQPFYKSAFLVIKQGKTNMDVPITVAIILSSLMSLYEIITFGHHSYFDSGVMLIFFLLIGRYLETRARGHARSAAQDLLRAMNGFVRIETQDGQIKSISMQEIQPNMTMLVNAGEKIGADGIIISGVSEIDTSLLTGETFPKLVTLGEQVFAGTINISAPLSIKVTKYFETSMLAEIIRLMEKAEQSQAHYVTLADRISRLYTPVVHALALMTFLGWVFFTSASWQVALLYAATVLIITCPCALGLAVPVVQVIASSILMRKGILLKSGSALERLAKINIAVFDKTGTLTKGKPQLENGDKIPTHLFKLAASMATKSSHLLSKALASAYKGHLFPLNVQERVGFGLETQFHGKSVKLGKKSWVAPEEKDCDNALEFWLRIADEKPYRFIFSDQLREDAYDIIAKLKEAGLDIILLSGDRENIVQDIAEKLNITNYFALQTPVEKVNFITQLRDAGFYVMMVGDGLNDAPSLSAATLSFSPSSALDITQNAADIVFYGEKLFPILISLRIARFAQALVKSNFLLAIGYNLFAIPLAVLGYVTPLIAALAMSSSSIIVILNSFRLKFVKTERI